MDADCGRVNAAHGSTGFWKQSGGRNNDVIGFARSAAEGNIYFAESKPTIDEASRVSISARHSDMVSECL